MRSGVRYGIDVGKARVGVARCDREGLLAVPSETLTRESAIESLVNLGIETDVLEWVIGLPVTLDDRETLSTVDAHDFARELVLASGVPARLVDERLTTASAMASLHGASHTVKSSRGFVDQVAATILLQTTLDAERAGTMLGEMLEVS
jgi:putative Holliday junction resolvase